MAVMNMPSRFGLAALEQLRSVMHGKVAVAGDGEYENARQIWNGAVDHHPALIAFCKTPEDVQTAVHAARSHRLPLSVRGGGHDWAGRALRPAGLVVDLSMMRGVEVDARAQTATVAGGVTAKDLAAAAAPYNLAAVTGTVGSVGMAGLTLGGGYGPLNPRYGLALDNLLAAEVVLADGQLVTANQSENSDLFWAPRGGGGNFGVVTPMRIRLHPIRELLVGFMMFPWCEAHSVLGHYAKWVAAASDQLAVIAGMMSAADGASVVFLAPVWSGEQAQGYEVMKSLERLGRPIVAQIDPMTCSGMLDMFETQVPSGRHYAVRTRWLPELADEAISILVAAGAAKASPFATVAIHHFHGAATRIPLGATAFGLRREHFLVEIIAAWEPAAADDGAIHRQWAQNLSQALAPAALPGGYANLLGPDEYEQIASAYGSNLSRL